MRRMCVPAESVAVLGLSACHGKPTTTSVQVSWSSSVRAQTPISETWTVSGTSQVSAQSPRWATPGSDIPIADEVQVTGAHLAGFFLRVTGADWTGGETGGMPVLGYRGDRGFVTASAPGEVVVEISGGVYYDDSSGVPVGGYCDATADAPLARIQVVGRNPT